MNKQKREITLADLKIIQMDILSAIDEYCKNNGIRYSMACGTLLGAIRHKGYIPWDDDIDIYVPRADYKQLVNYFPLVYKGKYEIISLERNSQWERPYAKAYDNSTIFEEYSNNSVTIGINIDIFPIDDVPQGDQWNCYNKKRRFQQSLFALKFVKLCKKRSFVKNLLLVLFQLIFVCYSKRKWAEELDALSQRFNGRGCEYCYECCLGMLQRNPFQKALFDDLIYIPFEDREFQAFANYDNYLRNGYGDYMQLPPEEKRVSHHVFKAYWK